MEETIEGLRKLGDIEQIEKMNENLRSQIESLRLTFETSLAQEHRSWSDQVKAILSKAIMSKV